jgi:hypothetical protein
VVLCRGTMTESDSRALKIAEFLGVEATAVTRANAAPRELVAATVIPGCTCLIVDAETLASVVEALPGGVSGLAALIGNVAAHVFVYGFRATERHTAVLRELSGEQLIGLESPTPGSTFAVGEGTREWTAQFSGVAVRPVDPRRDSGFIEAPGQPSHLTLIRADGKPFFVRTRYAGAQMFLLGCSDLADLDEPVDRHCQLLSWFSRLLPLMMFLRGALKERVWHNRNPRACFIIDDPLLRSRYGFLEFARLAESLRQQRFSASIAFIPWNYRRSSHDVAALFRSTNGMSTLCVHGCDHTRAEFATSDVESLIEKAHLALDRMRAHYRLSGVPFDDVMVFPQGLFSPEAIVALRTVGYLAAVNSHVFPSTVAQNMPLRELLEVAVTCIADFPLFGRHYPGDPAEFALDLFLGKPALAVEHHGYFRDGYTAIEQFVQQLTGLDERLEWTDLETICSRACLTKSANDGAKHVRFFTSRFRLTNSGHQREQYVLVQRRAYDEATAVLIDGQAAACEQIGDRVRIRLSLDAGQTVVVRVPYRTSATINAPPRETSAHAARVRVRRYLSEFRDNYVQRNRALTAVWNLLRRLASRTVLTVSC